jgi:SAM-dependent methyltransferase
MSEDRRASSAPTSNDVGVLTPNAGDVAMAGPAIGAEGTPLDADGRTIRADGVTTAARRRGRMTLRIPDDEVARPQTESDAPPSVSSYGGPTPSPAAAVAVMPMRIISIESDLPPAPPVFDTQPAPPPRELPKEDRWTPWSPAVETIGDGDQVDESEDVEVLAHVSIDADGAALTTPRLAIDPSDPLTERQLPLPPSTPSPLVGAEEEEDDEEVRFDDEPLTPALPRAEPVSAERGSDPGDAPEISAEDLVAIESAPLPPRPSIEVPPMRARVPSQTQVAAPAARPLAAPALPTRRPLVIVPPHVGNMGPQAADNLGLRRKGRLWWEELFNDDYVRTMEKVTDAQIATEVDFIETSLGLERGGAILDLACGTGRQAIELARRGYEVVAFDLSLSMLARAGDEAQERDVKLNFIQGDMREMTFEEQFDGVYCWNTAFGFFDEEKNAQVVDRVRGALKAGGLFLLDVVNRDFIVRQSPSLAWFEGDGCVCMDEMTIDFITSRMKVKRTLMLDDGRTRETEYSVRVYSLHELGKILHEHGFKVTEVSGRVAMPGVFFGNESPRIIILAEKR